MTDSEKIQLLLNSRTKENNYIAMCLMLEVFGLTFEEAFAKLQLCVETPYQYSIEIAEIRIFYDVELQSSVGAPPYWAFIHRHIFLDGVRLEEYQAQIHIDEGWVSEIDGYLEYKDDIGLQKCIKHIVDTKDIDHIIKYIVPIAKKLFEQVHSKK